MSYESPPRLPPHLRGLLSADAYPHAVGKIRVVETHISWIVLTGDLSYKIKRPVRYPFVDMRTFQRRAFLCEEELRLNRRFAPDLYLAVTPITSDAGRVRVGGVGEVIEHAVVMRQFDVEEELAELIGHGRVIAAELAEFGRDIARIHQALPRVEEVQRYGTLDTVRASLIENISQLLAISARAKGMLDEHAVRRAMLERLASLGSSIEARRAAGRVRECHGDLHCRNVVRHSGRLIAFDCLEFEPAFRWIDVAEEIAFLFMDLTRRDAGAHAFAFLNAWLAETGDYSAARVIRMYGAHRALVRAKVAALEMKDAGDSARSAVATAEHDAYIHCAQKLLSERPGTVVLVTGLSGSGKTWLSERISRHVGALHVRSDIERKRLGGIAERASSESALGQGLYAADMSSRTYARLAECAKDVLAGGFPVIVDATFQQREHRALFSELAAQWGAHLLVVHAQAAASELRQRVLQRAVGGSDASEANLAVLEAQMKHYEPIVPDESLQVIVADTTRPDVVSDVVVEIERALSARVP